MEIPPFAPAPAGACLHRDKSWLDDGLCTFKSGDIRDQHKLHFGIGSESIEPQDATAGAAADADSTATATELAELEPHAFCQLKRLQPTVTEDTEPQTKPGRTPAVPADQVAMTEPQGEPEPEATTPPGMATEVATEAQAIPATTAAPDVQEVQTVQTTIDGLEDLKDIMGWPHHFWSVYKSNSGEGALQAAAELIPEAHYSSAFSGIDAPGTGMEMTLQELRDLVGDLEDVPSPEHSSAIEWLPESQQELLLHPNPPTCLFADIGDFLAKIPLALPFPRQFHHSAIAGAFDQEW